MEGKPRLVLAPARRTALFIVALTCVFGMVFGPAGIGVLLAQVILPGNALAAVVAGVSGFVLGLKLQQSGMARLSAAINHGLRRDVGKKLAAYGLAEVVEAGQFVGMSPGAQRRTYYGDNHWDIGFLLLGPGWLAYYGDQACFCLRADQIQRLELDPPTEGGMLKDVRLMVEWREPELEQSRTLSFGATDFKSRPEARRKLEELRDRLAAWRATPAAPVASPLPLPPLEAPGGTVAEPALLGLQLAIGLPLAVLTALISFGIRIAFGIEVPVFLTIAGSVILSSALAQFIYQQRKR
ncbi:MAG TPA: hypothetical protein VK689_20605 [Armatimonadota bacterium]|nr:hypothetical protein [Armatimonadota bacterium]